MASATDDKPLLITSVKRCERVAIQPNVLYLWAEIGPCPQDLTASASPRGANLLITAYAARQLAGYLEGNLPKADSPSA